MRFVLASASPARLQTLQRAGVQPVVHVSGVDEDAVEADNPAELACVLARLKAEAVAADLGEHDGQLILGCDSLLEFDGQVWGKPRDAEQARQRWRSMSGRSGTLLTGHHLIMTTPAGPVADTRLASTVVHFATLSDDEITAYVDTAEPLHVAGAFTIDGLGGPFVERIEGDHHNVVGLSLPLLRTMLLDHGVAWGALWSPRG